MDLKTALIRFTNVHQELKPKQVISKAKKTKPVYEYKHYSNVSTKAVLGVSKGYDFQPGI